MVVRRPAVRVALGTVVEVVREGRNGDSGRRGAVVVRDATPDQGRGRRVHEGHEVGKKGYGKAGYIRPVHAQRRRLSLPRRLIHPRAHVKDVVFPRREKDAEVAGSCIRGSFTAYRRFGGIFRRPLTKDKMHFPAAKTRLPRIHRARDLVARLKGHHHRGRRPGRNLEEGDHRRGVAQIRILGHVEAVDPFREIAEDEGAVFVAQGFVGNRVAARISRRAVGRKVDRHPGEGVSVFVLHHADKPRLRSGGSSVVGGGIPGGVSRGVPGAVCGGRGEGHPGQEEVVVSVKLGVRPGKPGNYSIRAPEDVKGPVRTQGERKPLVVPAPVVVGEVDQVARGAVEDRQKGVLGTNEAWGVGVRGHIKVRGLRPAQHEGLALRVHHHVLDHVRGVAPKIGGYRVRKVPRIETHHPAGPVASARAVGDVSVAPGQGGRKIGGSGHPHRPAAIRAEGQSREVVLSASAVKGPFLQVETCVVAGKIGVEAAEGAIVGKGVGRAARDPERPVGFVVEGVRRPVGPSPSQAGRIRGVRKIRRKTHHKDVLVEV